MTVTEHDLMHLRRAVDLAAEAAAAGDGAFGSVLVDADGNERFADRNREQTTGDPTRHPEFEIARWAAAHLTPAERGTATVYTSGEHCPMCAAAHAWVGLGRIVYAASSAEISGLACGVGRAGLACRGAADRGGGTGNPGDGPVDRLAAEVRALLAGPFENA